MAVATNKEIAAGEKVLKDALAGKPENELMCRAMRHNWSRAGMRYTPAAGRGFLPTIRLIFHCDRGCGVQRHDVLTIRQINGGSKFTIVDRSAGHYVYPDGYQIPGVPRGVKPSTIHWQEFVRRNNQEIANAAAGEREHSE